MKSITSTLSTIVLTAAVSLAVAPSLDTRVANLEKQIKLHNEALTSAASAMQALQNQIFGAMAVVGMKHPDVMKGLKSSIPEFAKWCRENDI